MLIFPGVGNLLAAEQRRDRIANQLQQILASRTFARSARRRAILEHIVGMALEDRAREITGATIAADIYGREGMFHADQDAIVRVEMGRLRASLESYYAEEGANSSVRIVIPKGSYAPVFEVLTDEVLTDEVPALEVVAPEGPAAKGRSEGSRSRILWWVAGAVLVFAALAFVFWKPQRTPEPSRIVFRIPGRQRQPVASPEGGRIAFVRDGEAGHDEIYAGTITGDRVWQVTAGAKAATSPAWSPDGKKIAFLLRTGPVTQDVCVADAEPKGTPQAPWCPTSIHTVVGGIAWTANSEALFIPDSPPEHNLAIHRVLVANGERHAVTAERNFFAPHVSPDGKTLLFMSDAEAGSKSALYLMQLDARSEPAGAPRRLDATVSLTIHRPRWSADGRSILFASADGVMRYRLGTNALEKPVEFPEAAGTPEEFAPGRFVFTRFERQTYLATVSGAAGERPVPLSGSLEQDSSPDLSPDGRRLAFLSKRDGSTKLLVAAITRDASSGSLRRADAKEVETQGAPSSPRWSNDGTTLAFHTSDGGGGRQIYVLRDGGRPVKVATGPGDAWNPVFSRDRRHLYFASERGNAGPHIWEVALDGGGGARRVTDSSASFCDESLDGRFFYFAGSSGVWRQAVPGGQPEQVSGQPVFGPLRLVAGGMYLQLKDESGNEFVRFQPADPGIPARNFASPDLMTAWTPVPQTGRLLASFARRQSKVELLNLR